MKSEQVAMNTVGNSFSVQKKRRVLIVNDHPLIRRGVADVISQEPDLEACGQAGDIAEALEQVEKTHPDAVIIDISLKSGQGLDLIEQIKAKHEEIKMLVSSMHDEMLFAERSLRAGAGLPAQTGAARESADCHPPGFKGRNIPHAADGEPPDAQHRRQNIEGDPIKTLSNREVEVFEMIGQGLTTQNIARKLNLSTKTIETHRENIKGKLNLKNSAELNRRAVQWVLENY